MIWEELKYKKELLEKMAKEAREWVRKRNGEYNT